MHDLPNGHVDFARWLCGFCIMGKRILNTVRSGDPRRPCTGIDLGIHQQGHDHPDSEVKGPLKIGKLALNHTFGKHIQDPC